MLNKREFVDISAEWTGATKKDIRKWTTIILECIKMAYADYGGVKFNDFGTFTIRTRKPRMGHDPNDPSVRIPIGERRRAFFQPGKELRAIINESTPK